MARRTLLLGAFFLGMQLHAQNDEVVVRFSTGSTVLSAEAIAELQALCNKAQGRTLSVSGHSDDRGSADLNQRLSLERADRVVNILKSECPDLLVTQVRGQGGTMPVADNTTEAGRMLNRRVEVSIAAIPIAECVIRDPRAQHGHARVTPLMPAADKARELYSVDASKDIEVRTSDGTILRIAAGSILDTDGQAVNGLVDLTYRSFMDPWEVVASGIPMHVGMPGNARHFETAGMYEVYASKEGRPVQLRAGAEIALETPGPQVSSEYQAYQLNEATGEWENGGRFVDPVPMVAKMPSAAAREYVNIVRKQRSLPDSSLYDARKASAFYCHTSQCIPTAKPYAWTKGKYHSPYGPGIPSVKLDLDRNYWREHREVALNLQLAYRNHPEWRAFGTNKRWIYAGDLDRRTLRKTFVRKHYYQDIEMVQADNGGTALHLKDRGIWVEIPVALTDHLEPKNDPKNMDGALAGYQKRKVRKATQFDQEVLANVKRTHAQRTRVANEAFSKATRRMNASERKMAREDFIDYAFASTAQYYSSLGMRDNTYMFARRPTFAMPGFGIWNCDRMIPMPVVEVPVEVIAQDGAPFIWQTAYGVPQNSRAVVTYWNLDGTALQTMRLSPSCERIIFVDQQKRMMVAEIQAGKRGKKNGLVLQALPLEQPKDRKVLELLARNTN